MTRGLGMVEYIEVGEVMDGFEGDLMVLWVRDALGFTVAVVAVYGYGATWIIAQIEGCIAIILRMSHT